LSRWTVWRACAPFSTGGPAGRSFLSIRGGEPNFTLVLLEGMRLNDPTNSRGGGFDFFMLDPWAGEAVAVSRGAGSPAMARRLVRRGEHRAAAPGGRMKIQARARLGGGTEDERGVGLSLSHGWGGGGLLVGASWHPQRYTGAWLSLERRQALARVRQDAGPAEIAVTALYGAADRSGFPEDSGGPLLAASHALEQGRAELHAIGLTVRGDRAKRVRPNLSVSWVGSRRWLRPRPSRTALSGHTRADGRQPHRADGGGGGPAFETGRLSGVAGAAWLDEDGRSDGSIDFGFPLPVAFELHRRTASAFAEARLQVAAGLSFDAAARYDHVKAGSGRWTGRIGAAWQLSPSGPTLYARLASGYKLPSFYALGHPLVGNPALAPERSRNAELGVEWRPAPTGTVRLSLFRNRFRDLIDFEPAIFKLVNRNCVDTAGAEIEARWQPAERIGLAGAVTLLDVGAPTPLRGRPALQGSVRGHWTASDALEVNARVAAIGRYHDSSIPTGPVRADGHVEADLGVRYRLSARFTLAATLHNLTGSRHQDAVGFPSAGARLRAGVELSLF
jgi:outer membrane receptor protein involved in Fe transport